MYFSEKNINTQIFKNQIVNNKAFKGGAIFFNNL